jgi:hypothetical protein
LPCHLPFATKEASSLYQAWENIGKTNGLFSLFLDNASPAIRSWASLRETYFEAVLLKYGQGEGILQQAVSHQTCL